MKASDFTVRLAARVSRLLSRGPAAKVDMLVELEVSGPAIQRSLQWLREEACAPLTFDRSALIWRIAPGWSVPGEHVDLSELLRAWAQLEQLRRMLEADDVVEEVERMILDELCPAEVCPKRPLR